MPSLAEQWLGLTQSAAVFVSVLTGDRNSVEGILLSKNGECKELRFECKAISEWDAGIVADELNEFDDSFLETQAVPFPYLNRVLGGVMLLSDDKNAKDRHNWEEWGALCGRLLTQANLVEQASDSFSTGTLQLSEKLEAMAEFAAGAGHEINNPATTIVGRANMLLKDETDPYRRQMLATIGGEAYRIRDMMGDVTLFARPPQPKFECLDITEDVKKLADKLADEFQNQDCELRVSLPDSKAEIEADETQFFVAVSNLLKNSLNASSEGDCVEVSVSVVQKESRQFGLLTIHDIGAGFSLEEREHLFDPFYSGRQAGRGLGFGLPKCWRILSNHGGWIEVDSDSEQGTTVKTYWPVTHS